LRPRSISSVRRASSTPKVRCTALKIRRSKARLRFIEDYVGLFKTLVGVWQRPIETLSIRTWGRICGDNEELNLDDMVD
jgi:hypothetical protein